MQPNMPSREELWDLCIELINTQSFDQAIQILEPMNCAMADCLKAKVHLAQAEKIMASVAFKFYVTNEMKEGAHKLLMDAYGYFFEASAKSDLENSSTKDLVKKEVFQGLDKLEGMLIPCVPDPVPDDADEYITDAELESHTETMTDKLADWKLEMEY